MTDERYKVTIKNIGWDGESKQVTVELDGVSISKYFTFNSPWRNWSIRRFVKSAKKTLKNILDQE